MSQPKLTLRPPPNIEFVQGYPGISPSAPDRTQAAVKGTIELRLGPQGVKAKWVRIELRKVETLPGAGQANTFYDCVGGNPITIWQAPDEWSLMNNRDFSFFIRIPESIPPSISLDKGAGIRYELVATLCYKGKSGFFRRSSSPTLHTTAPVIIDKHELHSTWPIYAQQETRQIVADGLTLAVDRTHTCYGPGDRVSVLATLKSDSLATVVLRAFEFQLKETIVFRSEPHVSGKSELKRSHGKKGAPQVRVTPIGDQKVPVNVSLFGGTAHRVELSCTIPQTHTTTTVTAARHIDIAYVLNVKAILGSGKYLSMDLPVIISNWPRSVSIEAVRRIGPAPNLTLVPIGNVPVSGTLPSAALKTTSGIRDTEVVVSSSISSPTYPMHLTAPAKTNFTHPYANGYEELSISKASRSGQTAVTLPEVYVGKKSSVDEFGLRGGAMSPIKVQPATVGDHLIGQQDVDSDDNDNGIAPLPSPDSNARRPRVTVTNGTSDYWNSSSTPQGNDALIGRAKNDTGFKDVKSPIVSGSVRQTDVKRKPSSTTTSQWLPAEEEKRRLFDRAQAQVARVQNTSALSTPIPFQKTPTPHEDAGRIMTGPLPSEEEKLRLFEQAQETARITQARAVHSATAFTTHDQITLDYPTPRLNEEHSMASLVDSVPTLSPGATLYSNAMSSLQRVTSVSSTIPQAQSAPISKSFPTAEEEKAALRYYEAKLAVDRHAGSGASASIPKAQDYPPDPSKFYSPTNTSPVGKRDKNMTESASPMAESALAEKDRLRRRFEGMDKSQTDGHNGQVVSQAVPPSASLHSPPSEIPGYLPPPGYAPPTIRTRPSPPVQSNGIRPLTAAEEKAQLHRRYATEEATREQPEIERTLAQDTSRQAPDTNGNHAVSSRSHMSSQDIIMIQTPTADSSAPPPLMPRPPADYIRETEEEDARLQAEEQNLVRRTKSQNSSILSQHVKQSAIVGLNMRPFTPFNPDLGLDSVTQSSNLNHHVSLTSPAKSA